MTLDVFANIAEIVGLILVLVTLVFLTLQINQNTKALRATAFQAVLQSEMAFASLIAEHASVWGKMMASTPLESGEETRRAIILYNMYMIDTESRYHQFQSGYLEAQAWEARHGTLPSFLMLSVYHLWRDSLGGQSRSADFLELVDEMATIARSD
jgi:hypothetical protein